VAQHFVHGRSADEHWEIGSLGQIFHSAVDFSLRILGKGLQFHDNGAVAPQVVRTLASGLPCWLEIVDGLGVR
jgi:hypothetical protein